MKHRHTLLAKKYLSKQASPEEIAELHNWYDSWQNKQPELIIEQSETEESVKERILHNILRHDQLPAAMPVSIVGWRQSKWLKVAAAAGLIFTVTTVYLLINRNHEVSDAGNQSQLSLEQPVITPGTNTATLTLADGTELTLDDANPGTVSTQGNIKVLKLNDGKLSYQKAGNASAQVSYNTITTPRGGKYQVVLADGTKIWLNAASSLRFPTFFSGKERRVEMSGEVYFEVAKNAEKPFIVSVLPAATKDEPVEIRVLGTHFNINAYGDEASIKTTLVEGSVRVNQGKNSALLKPGQQAEIISNKKQIGVKTCDTEKALAWTNGRFIFNDDVHSIMRQVSRWYDVDIAYEENVVNREYVGNIAHSQNVSEVLRMLSLTGTIDFKIEGRKIIVKAVKNAGQQ